MNSMINYGSVCSIMKKTLAKKTLQSTPSAQWITSKCEKDLKTYSNERTNFPDKISTTVVYDDWKCEDSLFTVMENGHKLIIRRDLFSSLSLAVVQQQAKWGKSVNNSNSKGKIKQALVLQLSYLVSNSAYQRHMFLNQSFSKSLLQSIKKVVAF